MDTLLVQVHTSRTMALSMPFLQSFGVPVWGQHLEDPVHSGTTCYSGACTACTLGPLCRPSRKQAYLGLDDSHDELGQDLQRYLQQRASASSYLPPILLHQSNPRHHHHYGPIVSRGCTEGRLLPSFSLGRRCGATQDMPHVARMYISSWSSPLEWNADNASVS